MAAMIGFMGYSKGKAGARRRIFNTFDLRWPRTDIGYHGLRCIP